MKEIITGNDLIPDGVEVYHTDGGVALVPIDEIDITLGARDDCDHVFWYTPAGPEMDERLYALEPDPETGYWTCCPACGLILGQRNLGSVPAELRTI